MADGTFATEAPRYWEHGFRVLPIVPRTKKPPMTGWSGFVSSLPSEETRCQWLEQYGSYGIGLLLGSEILAGEVIVAIDVDDDRFVRLATALLTSSREPASQQKLSSKVGKKGATFFARMAGKPKSTAFKGAGDLGGIDILASGKQTVMPPSLHPDTGQPYRWIGLPLLDIPPEDLPPVDDSLLNLLKVVVTSENAAALISGHTTHDAGLKLCAQLVRADVSDQKIEAIFVALLPEDYSGNSLEELPEWIKSAREKFSASDDSVGQGKAGELVTMVMATGIELSHDANMDAYISVPSENGFVTHRLPSSLVDDWIRHKFFEETEKPLNSNTLREAVQTFRAIAKYCGEERRVFNRVAGDDSVIEIDIGDKTGAVIRIIASEWTVEPQSRFRFIRDSGCLPLPLPERGGDLRELQNLLGLDDESWLRLVIFLVNAWKPTGPYFWQLIQGAQGSGKSFFAQIVKMLIDPNVALRASLPDNERELMIHAKTYWLLNYDNASGMRGAMSDALCKLSSGGGIGTRRLYTDDELHTINVMRPFMINGIAGVATRSDLLQRAIPIHLRSIPDGKRRTESEMLPDFRKLHPRLLGALCDAVATALANFDRTEPPRDIRMADAAHWAMAAAPAFGVESSDVQRTIKRAQDEITIEHISNEPLAHALYDTVTTGEWEGNIGDLYEKFLGLPMKQSLPKTPAHLSKALHRLEPSLAKIGIAVEFIGRSKKGQRVRITVSDPSKLPEREPSPF